MCYRLLHEFVYQKVASVCTAVKSRNIGKEVGFQVFSGLIMKIILGFDLV
jgi:hypothetical protein